MMIRYDTPIVKPAADMMPGDIFRTQYGEYGKAEPEDGNDHCINSCQYAWLPFKSLIGSVKTDEI